MTRGGSDPGSTARRRGAHARRTIPQGARGGSPSTGPKSFVAHARSALRAGVPRGCARCGSGLEPPMHLHTAAALLLLALPAFAQVPRDVAAPPADVLAGVVRLPAPEAGATRSSAAIEPAPLRARPRRCWTSRGRGARRRARPVRRRAALRRRGCVGARGARRARRVGAAPSRSSRARAHGPAARRRALRRRGGARWDVAEALPGALALRVVARGEHARGGLAPRARRGGARVSRRGSRRPCSSRTSRSTCSRASRAPEREASPRSSARASCSRRNAGRSSSRSRARRCARRRSRGRRPLGADVPRGVAGELRARVDVVGTLASGAPFARSSVLAFPVLERRFVLDGAARASELDCPAARGRARRVRARRRRGTRARLRRGLGPERRWERAPRVLALTAVHAARRRRPRRARARARPPLGAELADARAPFELRAVRVQDPDTEVVYDRLDSLALALPSSRRARAARRASSRPRM